MKTYLISLINTLIDSNDFKILKEGPQSVPAIIGHRKDGHQTQVDIVFMAHLLHIISTFCVTHITFKTTAK